MLSIRSELADPVSDFCLLKSSDLSSLKCFDTGLVNSSGIWPYKACCYCPQRFCFRDPAQFGVTAEKNFGLKNYMSCQMNILNEILRIYTLFHKKRYHTHSNICQIFTDFQISFIG